MKEHIEQLHAALAELFPGFMIFLKIDAMNFFIGEVEIFYTASVEFPKGVKVIVHRASTPDDLITQAKAYARSINRGAKSRVSEEVSAAS